MTMHNPNKLSKKFKQFEALSDYSFKTGNIIFQNVSFLNIWNMPPFSTIVLVILIELAMAKIPFSILDNLIQDHNIYIFSCNRKRDDFASIKHFVNKYPSLILHEFPHDAQSGTFVLDAECSNSHEIFSAAKKFFGMPFKWIVACQNKMKTRNFFEAVDILVDSDLTVIVQNAADHFVIEKWFKVHSSGEILMERVENQKSKRKNLRGTVLNTSIVITNPDSLNHLTDKRDPHIDSIEKVDYVLVEHLADIVNATLRYSVEKTWGYKQGSTWSGMIGALVGCRAEIGGTALFLTSDRVSIIDYVAMITPTRSKFIFRQPKLSVVTNVFTLPFNGYVWASTTALVILSAGVLYLTIKWEKMKTSSENAHQDETLHHLEGSWIEIAFVAFGALCQQGTNSVPSSLPGRITLMFLFTSLMFLYTSYSANIVALLQSSSNSIQTLKDILQSRLDVGVDDTIFNHFYFPNASEPVRKALYQQKVAPPGQKPKFYPIDEGIRKIREGLFAFHVETGPGYKYISETFLEDEKCGLNEVQFLQVPDPWLAIRKNSSYKKILKIGLHQLQENGLQAREVGLIYKKKPQCLSSGSSFISVGLVDCYPAAVVFLGGVAASLLVLILEILIYRNIHSRG